MSKLLINVKKGDCDMKDKTLHFLCASIIFLIGTALLVISFFLPPMGVIDPSVLEGAGLIFMAGAIFFVLATKGNYVVRWKSLEIIRTDANININEVKSEEQEKDER